MIKLEKDDLVQLTTSYIVEIFDNQTNEPCIGFDVNTGEIVRFKFSEIECVKKAKLEPCGSDDFNYWMFYTGPGYPNNTKENIAHWARYVLQNIFFDMSIEEIINKHIYWGTDDGKFNTFYNGDTYILYKDLNKLSEDMQYDAQQ
jgi:hypothetical protein